MYNFTLLEYKIHPYTKKLKKCYDIKDLTTDETLYRIYYSGFFTFTLHMTNKTENEIFTAKKLKFWKNEYTIFKQGKMHAILKIKSKMFDFNMELQIERRTYFSSKLRMWAFKFTDNTGNLAFIVKEDNRTSEKDRIIEIHDTIEPELAIFTSILVFYILSQPDAD